MESSFFCQPAKRQPTPQRKKQASFSAAQPSSNSDPNQTLRAAIIDFILSSCHFLEALYDPGFRWRTFLGGKADGGGVDGGPHLSVEDLSCPVVLHQGEPVHALKQALFLCQF